MSFQRTTNAIEDQTAGSHVVFAGVYNLQMYLFTIRTRYDLAITLLCKVTTLDSFPKLEFLAHFLMPPVADTKD